MFSIGLKGIDPNDADKVERLIADTLGTLAAQGIDPMTVAAALNTVEFRLRENNTGSFPRGIVFMLRALRSWLYGRDPLPPLAFEAPLAAVKARVAGGERYFEKLIDRLFIANPHRTVLILRPDREQAEREAKEEAARLARERARMSDADLDAVVEATRALKLAQETPDSPAALWPRSRRLRLADLPRANKLMPIEVTQLRDAPVLYHDLFTNGVVYLDVGFDLHTLPTELLPYVSLFGRALLETGVGKDDFVRLSQRIGTRDRRHPSDAVDLDGARRPNVAPPGCICAPRRFPTRRAELMAILRDILTSARLDNRDRFRQLVLEEKAAVESRLVPAGSSYVDRRLRSHFHEADWAEEQMSGISYLFFLRRLAGAVETDWEAVLAALERIRKMLFDRAALLCNVTAEAAHWSRLQPLLADFISGPAARRGGARPLAGRRRTALRGPGDSGQGQLRRQGRRPLRTGGQAERRQSGGSSLPAHDLAVGENPGAGRRLWRTVHARPFFGRIHLRLLPRPEPVGHARYL